MKSKIFIIVSIIFIQFLIIFYSYRLIHFYNLEHKKHPENKQIMLSNVLKEESLDKESGLQNKDDIYYYKGNIENNYIRYNGLLWRIIKFDQESITLISNEVVTSLLFGNISYKDSYVYKWLNNNFKAHIKNKEDLTSDISIITRKDYELVGGKESFVNSEDYIWINNDSNGAYIDDLGDIKHFNNKVIYGIKPVITLINDIYFLKGEGTINSPYEINYNDKNTLNERYIGEYLIWNNLTLRIISIDDLGVKVITENIYNEDLKQKFTNNEFNINNKNTLAYYLNNDFYNLLTDKESIIKSNFNIGSYGKGNPNFDNVQTKKIETFIGLSSIGDIFNYNVGYVITPTDSSNIFLSKKAVISESSMITSPYQPVFYLKGDIIIKSGNGTLANPLKVGDL